MINTHCRQSEAHCSINPEIEHAIGNIARLIRSSCRSETEKERETILLALKALGNAGVAFYEDEIKKCYEVFAFIFIFLSNF